MLGAFLSTITLLFALNTHDDKLRLRREINDALDIIRAQTQKEPAP